MTIGTERNGSDGSLGVAVFDTTAAACVDRHGTLSPLDMYSSAVPVPPAAIYSELPGGRLSVDLTPPFDVRGSGLRWPISARVERKRGCARFPVSSAWALCDHVDSERWQWRISDQRTASYAPVEALSDIVDQVLRYLRKRGDSQPITLAVPNTLDAETQDALLRALANRGVEAFLLWRPVASALAWVKRFGDTLCTTTNEEINQPIGIVLALHLGLDAFELACIELHIREFDGVPFVLPARSLPSVRTLYGEGLAWAEYLASFATGSYDSDGMAAWNLLWTTPWFERLMNKLRRAEDASCDSLTHGTMHDGRSVPQGIASYRALFQALVDGQLTRNQRSAKALTDLRTSWAPLVGPFRQDRLAAAYPKSRALTWLSSETGAIRLKAPVLGYVATGCFAAAMVGESSLADTLIKPLVNKRTPIQAAVEGFDCSVGGLLAEGCAICEGRRRRRIPPYLDTLPQLESLLVRTGEPAWEDLLGAKHRYVNGGETWKYRPSNLGLYVQREERDLRLSVWREGHETVREVIVALPGSVSEDTPVGLSIQMVPGQGNARIEVTPENADVFGGRRVYIDWACAKDTGQTRQQVLDDEPRTNPPLEPRGASLAAWCGAYWTSLGGSRAVLQENLPSISRVGAASLARQLNEVRKQLWRTDPDEKRKSPPDHYTSVSSDGNLAQNAPDPRLLETLIEVLDKQLASASSGEAFEEIVRTLGYCSANSPNLMDILTRAIETRRKISDYHLVAIGNCLRKPQEIARFMQITVECIKDGKLPERNEWLKALARLLQYREDAVQDIPSSACGLVSAFCLDILREQIENGSAKFLYRNASLCIVYLLRRRKYDGQYMEPTEKLAREAKTVFRSAIEAHRAGRLEVIGGIVDLPLLTQMMVDYVDRKGRGRLRGLAIVE